VALEIVQQLDWEVPDWVVIPGGNLGNVSALGAGFSMMLELGIIDRRPRICVAQAERANPLYLSYKHNYREYKPVQAQTTLASAIQIGNPVSYKKAVRALKGFDGVVEQANEQELADAAAHADRAGMYCCPHTGVALGALEKLADRGEITRNHRVVVVSTASGLKFSEFKTRYHEDAIAAVTSPKYRNVPIDLPDNYDAVRGAVLGALEDRR
ncbi:MAG: pyridoxal-phosphate dependent enzyme, partial [Myxococcota bacterium]